MQIHLTRILRMAERQWGVIARWQLLECGLSVAAISRWVSAGRLHRIYPGVYAVGHAALSTEGILLAAILYAGPGAALSHASAAHWWGLLLYCPTPSMSSARDNEDRCACAFIGQVGSTASCTAASR